MQTHMLVVSAIAFDRAGAGSLARCQGIDSQCVDAHDTFVFIVRPKSEFASRSFERINGNGYYVLKGQLL